MGNCLVAFKHRQRDGEQEEVGFEKGAIRVKILVNKEELEWLLTQLRDRKGAKRLEDILVEIRRGRGRAQGWKPSLESIKESPEVHTVEVNR